jgi:hypothetical protein
VADPEEVSLTDEITRLAANAPFVPFTIVMSSGQRYEIGGQDALAVGKSVLMLMPYAGGHHMLRNSQISEVIVTEAFHG